MFNTTQENDRIPRFDELLARCTQEEIRMMERDKPSNGNNPIAFSAHVKRKNNVGPRRQGQGFKPRFKEGRKGRCFYCNKFGHFARQCPHKKDTPRDFDNHNNNFKGNGNQRNNNFNHKGKRNAPAAQNGNGRPPKKSRNFKYEEVNVGEKQKEFYLSSSLTTTSPPDALDHWVIDRGTSRHFTGYKEALSNLIEKNTNMEIILGDNATYPMKRIESVTLHLNQSQTLHLQEVLNVPDLKKNQVSISVMEDKGFKVTSLMGRFVSGKGTREMHSLLDSTLKVSIRLEEVHWEQ